MLVLTRSAGEAVWIGDDVFLMVGKFHENYKNVQLLFHAPRSLIIKRHEISGRRRPSGLIVPEQAKIVESPAIPQLEER